MLVPSPALSSELSFPFLIPNPQILCRCKCVIYRGPAANFLQIFTGTEMHRRSRSRDRRPTAASYREPAGLNFDPLTVDRSSSQGDSESRQQANPLRKALNSNTGNGAPVEENFTGLEFKSTSSKKASRKLMKELIDKEMSKELEIRRSSPSLVARLMGLDALPPSVVPYQQKESVHSCQKAPVEFHEKSAAYEGYSCWTRANEYQECKDVFEVTEKLQVDKLNNQPIPKVVSSLKESENDVAFIKQKLMDAKYLSTSDAYQRLKERREALEDLYSNEDRFLNFLQETNPLFKMHLQDLKCSPRSPHASNITILKPSKDTNYEISELCRKSEKYARRSLHMRRSDISNSGESLTHSIIHSLKKHGQSLPCRLSDLQYTGKVKDFLLPGHIVILKPSLEKANGILETVPLARSSGNDQFGTRRHKEVPPSRTSEFYAEGRERQKLSDSGEVMGHKTTSSRKIARRITEHMRNTASSVSKEGSGIENFIMDRRSFDVSGIENFNSEQIQSTSDHLNHCIDRRNTSAFNSTESLLSREARKRMYERWKATHLVQEVGSVARRSRTLGEMLASSDRETPKTALNTSIGQNFSNGKVATDEVSERRDFPLGISSKDGWMGGWSRNLPRLKSNPDPPLVYQKHKHRRGNSCEGGGRGYLKNPDDGVDGNLRRRRTSSLENFRYCHNDAHFYSGIEEIQMSEREIHVNSEELRDRIHGGYLGEQRSLVPTVCNNSLAGEGNASMVPEHHNHALVGRGQEPDNNSSQEFSHWKSLQITNGQQRKESAPPAKDAEFPGHDWKVLMDKETSIEHPQAGFPSYQRDALESSFSLSFKEDQLNHVPMLELLPSEDDKSSDCFEKISSDLHVPMLEPLPSEDDKSSDCFEKISSDLHDLRMQLKLLKSESSDTYADDMDVLISSEDGNEEGCSIQKFGEIVEAFRDDEDRDFSYLLDVLLDSGVHNASPQYSVGPEVFEKLENKYNTLASWSRPERKLLFDLISSIVVEMICPSHNVHLTKPRGQPVYTHEGLVEKVWEAVVKQRKEPSSKLDEQVVDPKWMDLADYVATMAKDLEVMIIEDIVEELYCR